MWGEHDGRAEGGGVVQLWYQLLTCCTHKEVVGRRILKQKHIKQKLCFKHCIQQAGAAPASVHKFGLAWINGWTFWLFIDDGGGGGGGVLNISFS